MYEEIKVGISLSVTVSCREFSFILVRGTDGCLREIQSYRSLLCVSWCTGKNLVSGRSYYSNVNLVSPRGTVTTTIFVVGTSVNRTFSRPTYGRVLIPTQVFLPSLKTTHPLNITGVFERNVYFYSVTPCRIFGFSLLL